MKVNESFEYQGKGQNFTRDNFATLAEMKAVKAKTFPDIFTATCSETGKFYIYNKDNEVDEVLGKWREVSGGSSAGGSETLTKRDVEYIVQANMPTAVVYSKQAYDSMSGEELYKFLKTIYENVYQKTNNFDNITAESVANNTKLEITEFSCVSHDELISPMVMDRITEYTLFVKDGTETKRIAARGNLSREYTNTSVNSDSIKITAANPDFIETDTIDFSTWPEFTAPEANGIVLDGQGGANVDGSNVGVDPDDIEDDD